LLTDRGQAAVTTRLVDAFDQAQAVLEDARDPEKRVSDRARERAQRRRRR
jgi:hypothetical protein